MPNEEIYTPQRVARIQQAYRSIFPKITPELADYWGFERRRPWSCLTTDFHAATYAKLQSLHQQVRAIDDMGLTFDAKGQALRDAALALGVGYSIGISPWTDNLLDRTYSNDADKVVILLGHDWYPIVPDARPAGTPLMATDSLHAVERYWPGAPETVLEGRTVGLFVNLYPDYRPPGDPKCGSLHKYEFSYAQCLHGLDAMLVQVRQRFQQVQLVSWGSNVWTALAPRVQARAGVLLSEQVSQAPGQVLTIELGGQSLPYLPLMHPGHWGNFGRAYHLRHVKAGYAAMALGLPGLSTSTSGRARSARHIAID